MKPFPVSNIYFEAIIHSKSELVFNILLLRLNMSWSIILCSVARGKLG
jgi:hypothetical protein